MSFDQIIYEVGADRQESDGYAQLTDEFFLELHQTELRFIKLKYGRKSVEAEKELNQVIIDLVSAYTECIDYFGASGDTAITYFQIKIKQINKYFQFLNTHISHTPIPQATAASTQSENKKDLGSISEQTGTGLLPEEERQTSAAASKQALNHNLMVYLHSQDIGSHIKDNMKKQKKINNAITNSLKQQDDLLMKRKRNRNSLNKSRGFLSFSENALDHSRSIDPS